MFKSRKSGDESVATPPQAESIEAIRRRARHRLIGATVLVLIGVVAFPLLFDTQPRPIAVDIPIEIPDRNKVKPLPMPPAPAAAGKVAQAPAPSPVVAPPKPAASTPVAVEPAPKPAEKPAPVTKAESVDRSETLIETRPEARTEPKPDAKAAAAPKPDDGARARALLEGQRIAAADPAATGRFVVQVGAFADAAKAREARLKVERAGLKTYTHVAETKEGTRIRVRAGPFGSRAEADKAAEKIKGLDLPAAILTL
jgi:DedD protein